MKINLFHLCKGKQLGGSSTFVIHLYRSLLALGHEPVLYKIGKHSKKESNFLYGISYIRIDIEAAILYAKKQPSLITYCFWNEQGEQAKRLMNAGVPIIVHDPAEFREDYINYCVHAKYSKTIVIRQKNEANLNRLNVTATFIPHPYVPIDLAPAIAYKNGVSLVRVDFRKHQEIIIQANRLGAGIDMMGELNRMFAFHLLDKKYPDWRKWYRGEYPDTIGWAVAKAQEYKYCIDLTNIKTDGGGTQYSFFEAFNAGRVLVVNRAWLTGRESSLQEGVNCIAAETPEELYTIMQTTPNPQIIKGGRDLMKQHDGETIAKLYLKYLNV